MLLAAIAARTRRVRLGTCCLSTFPLRDPIFLAAQWAALDQVSHGRMVLGACIGGSLPREKAEAEFAAFKVKLGDRAPRLEEGITILRRLWTEEHVTHEGRFWDFRDLTLEPKPVQKPCPPIWIATNPKPELTRSHVMDRALRRVGLIADGWMTDNTPVARFRERWEMIRHVAREAGRPTDGMEAALHLMVNVNDDRGAAFEESVKFLHTCRLRDGRALEELRVLRAPQPNGVGEGEIAEVPLRDQPVVHELVRQCSLRDGLVAVRRAGRELSFCAWPLPASWTTPAWATGATAAVELDAVLEHLETYGRDSCPDSDPASLGDIIYPTALHAGEMIVGRGVRIEARAGRVDGLAKQAHLDKQSQISINRAETDVREPAAHTIVNGIRRGVQRTGSDDLEHEPSGPRQPEATGTQSLNSLIGLPSRPHCR